LGNRPDGPLADQLPKFDGAILEAKYARVNGHAFNDAQRDGFAVAERIAVRLALAERVLIFDSDVEF
jgi:FMN-dependent NADH-azoreductase